MLKKTALQLNLEYFNFYTNIYYLLFDPEGYIYITQSNIYDGAYLRK